MTGATRRAPGRGAIAIVLLAASIAPAAARAGQVHSRVAVSATVVRTVSISAASAAAGEGRVVFPDGSPPACVLLSPDGARDCAASASHPAAPSRPTPSVLGSDPPQRGG
ncbi:MAG TPA: hypothetical protein VLU43_16440 [Anaeromyxobacteraceae bacterium]|nr:hypothetical protein [Anaeromyxobacteraceae bacterium]